MTVISYFLVVIIRSDIQKSGANQLELGPCCVKLSFIFTQTWPLDHWMPRGPRGGAGAAGVILEAPRGLSIFTHWSRSFLSFRQLAVCICVCCLNVSPAHSFPQSLLIPNTGIGRTAEQDEGSSQRPETILSLRCKANWPVSASTLPSLALRCETRANWPGWTAPSITTA